jgi:hypothetical protein
MKRTSAHRHRRAAFLAITRITVINESKRDRDAAEWEAMRRRAEDFELPRDRRAEALKSLSTPGSLPACNGTGHAGAI